MQLMRKSSEGIGMNQWPIVRMVATEMLVTPEVTSHFYSIFLFTERFLYDDGFTKKSLTTGIGDTAIFTQRESNW